MTDTYEKKTVIIGHYPDILPEKFCFFGQNLTKIAVKPLENVIVLPQI